MSQSEFDKLVAIDLEIENHEANKDKVHEIALLEHNGHRPITMSGRDLDHGLYVEIDRSFNVHIENWNSSEICPARFVDVKETE